MSDLKEAASRIEFLLATMQETSSVICRVRKLLLSDPSSRLLAAQKLNELETKLDDLVEEFEELEELG